MTTDAVDPLIGTTIGNYEIKSLIGAGAMGQVFLGEHPQIGRKVAVKVLMASFSSNPEMADRFMSEAKAVNRINHPNIIQVFDFGKLPDGRLYLIMEFLEGQELSAYMEERGTLSIDDTIVLMGQIASALDAAHAAGIVHRDLKPDNIFVVPGQNGPVVKVLDFGVAKLLDPAMGAKHKTATGLIMGTPSYMSPEQARGVGAQIGPATDIYALGVIVYQMLSGHLPIDAESVTQVLLKHITDPPVPIFEYLPAFPPPLWDVIAKALEKPVENRPPTASEFYRMFVEAAKGIPAHITAVGMVSPVPARITQPSLSSSAVKTSMTGEQVVDPPRRSSGVWVAALLAVVVLGGGVWWFFLRGKGEDGMTAAPAAPDNGIAMADGTMDTPPDMPVADMPEDMPVDMPAADMPEDMPVDMPAVRLVRLNIRSPESGLAFGLRVGTEPEIEARTPFEIQVPEGKGVQITPKDARYPQKVIVAAQDQDVELTPVAGMTVLSPMPPSPMPADMRGSGAGNMTGGIGEDTIKIMF